MELTYYGANSWSIGIGGQRILVDPWLVGSLVFAGLPWLFEGKRPQALLLEDSDLILLSQGLADHAHKPTLQVLNKSTPVVGSANAARVARALGFESVNELLPGEKFSLDNRVEVRALTGAPIGPTRENAYLLKDLTTGHTLYYEPHGFPPETVKEFAPVDVAINPVVNLELPLAGPIINGRGSALKLAQWLRPQVMLPTAAGGDIHYSGALASLLQTKGSIDELRSCLAREKLATEVLEPEPGCPLALDLTAPAG
ncbi:putative Zn-dependent hydrolase of the beta-lactamase fold protein [Rubidibacter lacunae KORDI 51-2]|uniref:Putative Zn-dependent hydrolase of the beta-lactamase fold protein n=1 Tax=Rubidibacter lacunae KORDI 51-2 TaxID=582515 RepID=U5DMZ6_9CHRO|nr:MBL fold metallo-hydrolase [Rubidibacter lacunae]ERN41989.1 putative Zn-dependent hydrolase of the beta-lactamase fold protein [Rubidibacter lacunae KORDI 51-2]